MALLKHIVRALLVTSIVGAVAVESSVETHVTSLSQPLSSCATTCYDGLAKINNCKFKGLFDYDCLCKLPEKQTIKWCKAYCKTAWKGSDAKVCETSSRAKSIFNSESSNDLATSSDALSATSPVNDRTASRDALRLRREAVVISQAERSDVDASGERNESIVDLSGTPAFEDKRIVPSRALAKAPKYTPWEPLTSCGPAGITCAEAAAVADKRDAQPVPGPIAVAEPDPVAEPKANPVAEPLPGWTPLTSCGPIGITCADADEVTDKRDAAPVPEPIAAPLPDPVAEPLPGWTPITSCGPIGITCAEADEINDKRYAQPIPEPVAAPEPDPVAEPLPEWTPLTSCGPIGITCAETDETNDKRNAEPMPAPIAAPEPEPVAQPVPGWTPLTSCGPIGITCADSEKRDAAPLTEPKPEPAAEPLPSITPLTSCGEKGIICADTDKRDAEIEQPAAPASPSSTWIPSTNCGVWLETCASGNPRGNSIETTLQTVARASATDAPR